MLFKVVFKKIVNTHFIIYNNYRSKYITKEHEEYEEWIELTLVKLSHYIWNDIVLIQCILW